MATSRRRLAHVILRCALALLATVALTASRAGAQRPRLAEGRILKPSASGRPVPVPREWIVLHRVGSDRAAPLDSVRSGADGRFRFRYEASGAPDALYFVSARHDGIAYFSPPLRADTVRGEDADVMVYDTTTDTTTVHVQGRHLVMSAPRGNKREIAEVFELENIGTATLIARDSLTPLWRVTLPAEAESVSVAPGDVSAGAVTIRPGLAELYAPISPGVRQLVLIYLLPAKALPLALPVMHDVSVLEVLLEEPRAAAQGAKLAEVAPGLIDGRQFRRYLAQDVPANAVLRITAPRPAGQNRGAMLTLAPVMAVLMLGALIAWMVQRRRMSDVRRTTFDLGGTSNVQRQTSTVERLVAELATLDARFEKSAPSDAERAEYATKRADLRARIERALAEEQVPV